MSTRFTDAMVRADPSLIDVARAYAGSYAGSFDYLISARNAVELGWPLTTQNIRGILNCMLADSSVINMPEPKPVMFDASTVPRRQRRRVGVDFSTDFAPDDLASDYREFDSKSNSESEEEPMPAPKLPFLRDLNVTWHVTHGVCNHVQANVIHILDPQGSTCTWYPTGNSSGKEYVWRIKWACAASWRASSSPFGRLFLLKQEQVTDAIDQGILPLTRAQLQGVDLKCGGVRPWRMCKSCVKRAVDQ